MRAVMLSFCHVLPHSHVVREPVSVKAILVMLQVQHDYEQLSSD